MIAISSSTKMGIRAGRSGAWRKLKAFVNG
jgi:hypothetical protein